MSAPPGSNPLTPPFNPKQLGVAFFLFVTGYSLAREQRPWSEVLPRRLFEVYLYGISFALLIERDRLGANLPPGRVQLLAVPVRDQRRPR